MSNTIIIKRNFTNKSTIGRKFINKRDAELGFKYGYRPEYRVIKREKDINGNTVRVELEKIKSFRGIMNTLLDKFNFKNYKHSSDLRIKRYINDLNSGNTL